MPPKKGKKNKDKGKTKSHKTEERDLVRDGELQEELDKLTKELEDSKKKVNSLKADNEWLEQEAQRISDESQEYMSFMSKKANMRQNSIITLSDFNKKEIDELKIQKENLIKEYETKKQNLQNNLINKQNLLNKVREEIEDMTEFKDLKQTQLDEIQMLENEIVETRREQTKIINELRSEFLREKAEHKKDADNKIASIVKVATKEAKECLGENTHKIKTENQKLRSELLELIQMTKALTEHKDKLLREKADLTHEIKYAEDIKKIRSTQQRRVIEKLFPNLDD